MFKNQFHEKDQLLDGFTYDDLITAVLSNEPVITEQTIQKVFNELLQAQLNDTREVLRANMQDILKVCKENREV